MTWRATGFVDALVRVVAAQKSVAPQRSDVAAVEDFRHAVQHLDERIRLADDVSGYRYLSVTGVENECLVLHGDELRYEVLARVIRAMHATLLDCLT